MIQHDLYDIFIFFESVDKKLKINFNGFSYFSLGGNAKTLIICTITAAEEDQTKSTLEFASRAKKIVNHAEVIISFHLNKE